MADLSKLKKTLKKRSNLGAPPSFDEASQNLASPEVAPVIPQAAISVAKIDGRSLRKTNRTVQFATKVTPEYDEKFRATALRDNLDFCVLLEKMMEAYEAGRS